MPTPDTYYTTLTAAINDMAENGYDSAERVAYWQSKLREAAEQRQRWVVAQATERRTCLLDLHRLLPVPHDLLRLGPEHPEALFWLWAHWGTNQALRQVVPLPVPRRGHEAKEQPGRFWVGFWSADWTPWRAVQNLRTGWRSLNFAVRPIYDDG